MPKRQRGDVQPLFDQFLTFAKGDPQFYEHAEFLKNKVNSFIRMREASAAEDGGEGGGNKKKKRKKVNAKGDFEGRLKSELTEVSATHRTPHSTPH